MTWQRSQGSCYPVVRSAGVASSGGSSSVCTSKPEKGCPSSWWLHDSPSVCRSGRLATPWWMQRRHVIIAVIHQSHLALKITNVIFEAFSVLHLDCEEVIVIPLELPSRSVLVTKSPLYLFKALEWVPLERIEPVIDDAFEIGRKHAIQEEVTVKMARRLILVLSEVLDGIDRPRVAIEAQHYEVFGKAVEVISSESGESEVLKPQGSTSFRSC